MIVINPQNDNFTFSIIPKTYIGSLQTIIDEFKIKVAADLGDLEAENCLENLLVNGGYSISITDEQTKVFLGTFKASNISNSNDITNLFFEGLNQFYNDGFFTVEFKLFDEIVFKDKIFATTQDKNSYTINNNKYESPNIQNNDYIII